MFCVLILFVCIAIVNGVNDLGNCEPTAAIVIEFDTTFDFITLSCSATETHILESASGDANFAIKAGKTGTDVQTALTNMFSQTFSYYSSLHTIDMNLDLAAAGLEVYDFWVDAMPAEVFGMVVCNLPCPVGFSVGSETVTSILANTCTSGNVIM